VQRQPAAEGCRMRDQNVPTEMGQAIDGFGSWEVSATSRGTAAVMQEKEP
jgi:hypothetical protein